MEMSRDPENVNEFDDLEERAKTWYRPVARHLVCLRPECGG